MLIMVTAFVFVFGPSARIVLEVNGVLVALLEGRIAPYLQAEDMCCELFIDTHHAVAHMVTIIEFLQ